MKDLSSLGLRHENQKLWALDQTLLPHRELWVECRNPDEMAALIRRLAVRGAPLIGVAAAASLAKFHEDGASPQAFSDATHVLREARPTAVNLSACIDRITADPSNAVALAESLFDEDVALCERIAENGQRFIQDGDRILTHCNTGGLATVGIGTALGIIRKAHESGKKIHVFVDETRPLLQGARLTAWELERLKIPYTLICDNMAASLMKQGRIQKVFVGSDRIAKNGDFANKVGTYSLAVLAHHHRIPFYVAAPYTTVDESCATGAAIPIEERAPDEVRAGRSPANCSVYNPAFDVTPRSLVTSIILDRGVE